MAEYTADEIRALRDAAREDAEMVVEAWRRRVEAARSRERPFVVDALERELAKAEAQLWPWEQVERAEAAEAKVAALDQLFAGGPDTPCRTTWPGGLQCVEVPIDDLRAAFGDPVTPGAPADREADHG